MREHQTHLERASLAGNGSDYLIAMGVAAARHNPAILPMLRLHLASSPRDFIAAHAAMSGVVHRLNDRHRWRLRPREVDAVGWIALSHHIIPVCTHCHGLKFVKAAHADSLTPVACPHCKGDGRRPVTGGFKNQIEATLVALEIMTNQTEQLFRRIVS